MVLFWAARIWLGELRPPRSYLERRHARGARLPRRAPERVSLRPPAAQVFGARARVVLRSRQTRQRYRARRGAAHRAPRSLRSHRLHTLCQPLYAHSRCIVMFSGGGNYFALSVSLITNPTLSYRSVLLRTIERWETSNEFDRGKLYHLITCATVIFNYLYSFYKGLKSIRVKIINFNYFFYNLWFVHTSLQYLP